MKISRAEYARRRKHLMAMMDKDSIAIVPAANECTRSRDTEYVFRQDSDFLYLTGFNEPDAVLVLIPGRRSGQVIIFCRDRDPEMELWHGRRAGPEGVVRDHGVDDGFPVSDIDDILPGLMEGRQRIFYSMGHNDVFDRRLMGWINHIRQQVRNGATPPRRDDRKGLELVYQYQKNLFEQSPGTYHKHHLHQCSLHLLRTSA